MFMKVESLLKILIVSFALNFIIGAMNYFKPEPTTITPEDLQNMLDTQKSTLERQVTNTIRNEALKNMLDIHVIMADTAKYDSLWTIAYGEL